MLLALIDGFPSKTLPSILALYCLALYSAGPAGAGFVSVPFTNSFVPVKVTERQSALQKSTHSPHRVSVLTTSSVPVNTAASPHASLAGPVPSPSHNSIAFGLLNKYQITDK